MTTAPARHAATATPHPVQRWTALLDGHLLRQLRRQHDLSQKQLAAKAGISAGTVARLERQESVSCRSRTLVRLATALGEDPARLAPARQP